MTLILKPYEIAINAIACLTKNIDTRVRTVITHICVIALNVFEFVNNCRDSLKARIHPAYLYYSIIIVSVLLAILLIVNIDRKVDTGRIRINPLFWLVACNT